MAGKRRVTYFYDSDFKTFYFGQNHPMKPHRLAMTHHIVVGYGLHEHMEVYVSSWACWYALQQYLVVLAVAELAHALHTRRSGHPWQTQRSWLSSTHPTTWSS